MLSRPALICRTDVCCARSLGPQQGGGHRQACLRDPPAAHAPRPRGAVRPRGVRGRGLAGGADGGRRERGVRLLHHRQPGLPVSVCPIFFPAAHSDDTCPSQWRYLRAAMVLRVDALRGIPREPWQRASPSTLAPPPFLPLSTAVMHHSSSSSKGSAHIKYTPTSAPDDAATRPKSPARRVAAPVYVAGLYRFKAAAGAGGGWAARAAPVDEDAVAKTRTCLSAHLPRAKQAALSAAATDAPAAWAGWETSLDERRRQDGQVPHIFSYSPLFPSPSDREYPFSFLYMHNTRSGGQPSWWCLWSRRATPVLTSSAPRE